jgi:hypothetical protein
MINPVTSATHAQVATQSTAVTQQPAQAKPQAAPKDTVQISSAAKQILQESIETPAQTTKEAAGGDAQARRLLAREAAAKAAIK